MYRSTAIYSGYSIQFSQWLHLRFFLILFRFHTFSNPHLCFSKINIFKIFAHLKILLKAFLIYNNLQQLKFIHLMHAYFASHFRSIFIFSRIYKKEFIKTIKLVPKIADVLEITILLLK